MKTLVALAVFFLVSTQLFAEEIEANDDLNYWSDWSDSDQIKVSPGPELALAVPPELGSCHFPPRWTLVSLAGSRGQWDQWQWRRAGGNGKATPPSESREMPTM